MREQMAKTNGAGGQVPGAPGSIPPPGAVPNSAVPSPLNNVAADFSTPVGAVTAFLAAVAAKNPERIAEATALHAPTEAKGRNQKLFTDILEQTLSGNDLDDMAKKLDGFTIAGMNDPTSKARRGVILVKMTADDELRRTIQTRKEKKGWKVLDIGGLGELKHSLSGAPTTRPRRKLP